MPNGLVGAPHGPETNTNGVVVPRSVSSVSDALLGAAKGPREGAGGTCAAVDDPSHPTGGVVGGCGQDAVPCGPPWCKESESWRWETLVDEGAARAVDVAGAGDVDTESEGEDGGADSADLVAGMGASAGAKSLPLAVSWIDTCRDLRWRWRWLQIQALEASERVGAVSKSYKDVMARKEPAKPNAAGGAMTALRTLGIARPTQRRTLMVQAGASAAPVTMPMGVPGNADAQGKRKRRRMPYNPAFDFGAALASVGKGPLPEPAQRTLRSCRQKACNSHKEESPFVIRYRQGAVVAAPPSPSPSPSPTGTLCPCPSCFLSVSVFSSCVVVYYSIECHFYVLCTVGFVCFLF